MVQNKPKAEVNRSVVVSEEVFPPTTRDPPPPAPPLPSHRSLHRHWVARQSTWAAGWPIDARDRTTNWHTCVRSHPLGGRTTIPPTTSLRATHYPLTTHTLVLLRGRGGASQQAAKAAAAAQTQGAARLAQVVKDGPSIPWTPAWTPLPHRDMPGKAIPQVCINLFSVPLNVFCSLSSCLVH